MGNTVGSSSELHSLVTDSENAYILGLWCADGHHWTSSIGLTNVDKRLADRFVRYLEKLFPRERIKWQIYYPPGQKPSGVDLPMQPLSKAKQVAYRPYVNSRPLLRLFQKAESQVSDIPKKYILAYFAGRYDGDGSVDKDLRSDLRIAYSNRAEAKVDQTLLKRLKRYKARVYHYRSAKTYVLYVSRYDANRFLRDIAPYSVLVKALLPRRDLAVLEETAG